MGVAGHRLAVWPVFSFPYSLSCSIVSLAPPHRLPARFAPPPPFSNSVLATLFLTQVLQFEPMAHRRQPLFTCHFPRVYNQNEQEPFAMSTAEALLIISEYRDEHAADLTLDEFEAAGIAMVILAALAPAERDLIDCLLATPDPHLN